MDIPAGMYPRLHQMAAHGPLGGFFAHLAMQHQEQQRLAAGMSPEDWQAKINAHFAAQPVQHVPELNALPQQLAGLGGLSGTDLANPAASSSAPTTGLASDPTAQSGDWIKHLIAMLQGGGSGGGFSLGGY